MSIVTQQLFFFVILEPPKVIIKGCSIEVGVGSNTDPAPSIPCWVITSLPNSDFRRNTAGVWLEIAGFYTLISLMTNEAGKIRHKNLSYNHEPLLLDFNCKVFGWWIELWPWKPINLFAVYNTFKNLQNCNAMTNCHEDSHLLHDFPPF